MLRDECRAIRYADGVEQTVETRLIDFCSARATALDRRWIVVFRLPVILARSRRIRYRRIVDDGSRRTLSSAPIDEGLNVGRLTQAWVT